MRERPETCGDEDVTTSDKLLFWLSANGAGSWGQFRAAVEDLVDDQRENDLYISERLPLYQRLKFNLGQLGHVEFDANDAGGWRVSPPVLAMSESDQEPMAVLCGARLPSLITRLSNSRCRITRQSIDEAPELIRVASDDMGEIEKIASDMGLIFQQRASTSLLCCLPRVTSLHSWNCVRAQMPFGRDTKIERFDFAKRSYRWTDSSTREAQHRRGLYRVTRFQRREHYLRANGVVYRVPSQVGNYFLAAQRERQVLRYDYKRNEFKVSGFFRPPLLVDRALILCSGVPPSYDRTTSMLMYSGIPESIAGLAAFVLCQQLL
jgi:hypothetical protein